jgi:hypothetical protein
MVSQQANRAARAIRDHKRYERYRKAGICPCCKTRPGKKGVMRAQDCICCQECIDRAANNKFRRDLNGKG